MTNRAEMLIEALANAIMSSTEAAAERLDLAARVAQIQQKMAAFGAVLESVGAQKEALHNRLEDKSITHSQRQLIEQQINMLTTQASAVHFPNKAETKAEMITMRSFARIGPANGNKRAGIPVSNGPIINPVVPPPIPKIPAIDQEKPLSVPPVKMLQTSIMMPPRTAIPTPIVIIKFAVSMLIIFQPNSPII